MSEDVRKVIEGFYIGLTFGLGAIILELRRRRPAAIHPAPAKAGGEG